MSPHEILTYPFSVSEEIHEPTCFFLLELQQLSFPSIGSLHYDRATGKAEIVPFLNKKTFATSAEYVRFVREEEDITLLKDQTDKDASQEDRKMACWILRKAAEISLKHEYDSGPFPLRHPDLLYYNIMVDENYNITGIVEWEDVQTAPQEHFSAVSGFRLPLAGENQTEAESSLQLFLECLRKAEGEILRELEGRPCLALSTFVGSDSSECISKALDKGVPQRGIAYAKYLVPFVFGNGSTWQDARVLFQEQVSSVA
jgi:hypothetical protein